MFEHHFQGFGHLFAGGAVSYCEAVAWDFLGIEGVHVDVDVCGVCDGGEAVHLEVYDEGEVGKEPMIRILGRSPSEVVEKVLKIGKACETN